ncbi:25168_t:CDS:2, partial [Dentiscutata erythropus]
DGWPIKQCPYRYSPAEKKFLEEEIKAIQLRGFLGLVSYYWQFISGFTNIAGSLNALLKKNVNYHWTTRQQEVFEELKSKLVTASILAYPNFEKLFILFMDASDIALGAILSQLDTEDKE